MQIGERIKLARSRKGMSRPELADASGVKYPTLAGIENGDQAGTTKLPAIAEALGVSVRWLQTGLGPSEVSSYGDDDNWRDVPCYAQAVGAGAGTEVQQDAEVHPLKFHSLTLRKRGLANRRLAIYHVAGDSMEPRIRDGDAVMFDQDDTKPVHNCIYIVRWRGEEFIKRAKVVDDLVLFESDNPNGDHCWGRPKRMDNIKDPIEVIGRVRWLCGWED